MSNNMKKLEKLVLHIKEALEEKPVQPEVGTPQEVPVEETAVDQEVKADGEFFSDSGSEVKNPNSLKEQVVQALLSRSREIDTDDLPRVTEEMLAAFKTFQNNDYFKDLQSAKYYRLIDLRNRPETRVVVVGDIHSDFKSLAAILLKLTVSSYDYFEKGVFVFMGDYLDRGALLFEPLLLLLDLKHILGDRMIMLRGNHELIYYDEDTQYLNSRVMPQESVPCLNQFCGENKEFLQAFGNFYKLLPTYVYLKVKEQNILLTHGGIPRDIYRDVFRFDQETGAIVFEEEFLYREGQMVEENLMDDSIRTRTMKLNANLLMLRSKILYDMIWGDPSIDEEKYQVQGRFQFGRKQFDAYVMKNGISHVFRSHEPTENGFNSFFEQRLFTIFSTGGSLNDQSGYPNVQPAFAIINADGSYQVENSYLYFVTIMDVIDIVIDLFTEQILSSKAAHDYALHEEFACTSSQALEMLTLIDEIETGCSSE